MLLVDGHVHVYEPHLLAAALTAAAGNFARYAPGGASWEGLLLLADPVGVDSAAWLRTRPGDSLGDWRGHVVESPHHYRFVNHAGVAIGVVRGVQLASSEGLEVLSIGPSAERFSGPAGRMVEQIAAAGNLAILPWGVGKWWGRRGEFVRSMLNEAGRGRLLLGDNGGRPWFWPDSPLFRLAKARRVPVLPGSDSLPLVGDERRVGSMGARLDGSAAPYWPELKERLLSGSWQPFGRRMGTGRFLRNQVGLRLAHRGRGRESARASRS